MRGVGGEMMMEDVGKSGREQEDCDCGERGLVRRKKIKRIRNVIILRTDAKKNLTIICDFFVIFLLVSLFPVTYQM